MPQCKIHNVGFYSPIPRAIYCMSIERNNNKLALSRSDASIEIWDLNKQPFIERTIPPNLQNVSIEGLCWCSNNRLFSVGLHGMLVEYDLYKLCIKNQWIVTGEAATCLDINRNGTHIAVGTEQGYLNIFQIIENGVEFEKFLDKQEGRFICVKFDTTGEFLVTGSLNAIRIWNIHTGHAIHRMQLARSEARKETVVWCLEVMSDFTIFSGDSRGVLTLWDGKLGSQIETYQSHKADITAMCLSEEENSVYCAGVDPLITNYVKVKVGQSLKWVKSIQRKIHEHDVRGMVYHKNKLYSAGLDSYLACSYHPPKTLIKFPPILQSPCVQVASKARLILLRHPKHIEIWSLAETEKTEDSFRGVVPLTTQPKKLVVIQRINKNWADEEEGEGVLCSCISKDGQWILLGTNIGFRLYQLGLVKGKPSLTRIEDLDDSETPCVQAVFNDAHNQIIVALNNGNIVIYNIDNGQPFINSTILYKQEYLSDTVKYMTVSSCGKYLIAADTKSNIVVWTYHNDGYDFFTKLPKHCAPPTALEINSDNLCLVVAYSDTKIVEYDLRNREFTKFSRHLDDALPDNWKTRQYSIRSITFDAREKNVILLHDDSNIIVINKDKKPDKNKLSSKKAKTEKLTLENGLDESLQRIKIDTFQKYKHMVYLGYLSGNELVAVEVNPLSLLEKLPPAFALKSFGTK